MKRYVLLIISAIIVAAAFAIDRQTAKQATRPVLLELFTSQGCSSCPPADELLRRINNDPALRGKVIPLAYHVDYWDRLGWKDPFSARAWTQRQAEYIHSFELEGGYTPQIVINGYLQTNGSNRPVIYKAIEDESRRAAEGMIRLRSEGGDVIVNAQAPHENVEVIVVAFEDGATTKVERGENSGRTIENDSIVRKFMRVATIDGKKAFEQRVALPLGPRMGVAAFLQDVNTRRILAAANLSTGAR